MSGTEQQEILDFYCECELYRLKKMCNKMLMKIGGISKSDYDDFYSVALDVLADSIFKFEDGKSCEFNTFLFGNIGRRFNTEIRNRNRKKRIPPSAIQSLNEQFGDDSLDLNDIIPSTFDVHEAVFGEQISEAKVEKYISQLSKTQKKIVQLLMDGYKAEEIREILHITNKQYNEHLSAIRAYENVRFLM